MIPWTVACDDNNNVYITDIHTGRLSIFDPHGHLLTTAMLSTAQGLCAVEDAKY